MPARAIIDATVAMLSEKPDVLFRTNPECTVCAISRDCVAECRESGRSRNVSRNWRYRYICLIYLIDG
jgi:hypothetical protein